MIVKTTLILDANNLTVLEASYLAEKLEESFDVDARLHAHNSIHVHLTAKIVQDSNYFLLDTSNLLYQKMFMVIEKAGLPMISMKIDTMPL